MRKFASITFLTSLLTIFRMGAGFLISKVVAVYAGPAGLATLGQLQSFITMLNGITSAPNSVGLIKFTAKNANSSYRKCALWWRASFQLSFLLFTLASTICLLFSKEMALYIFNDQAYSLYINICVLMLPFSILGTTLASVLNGYQNYKKYFIVTFSSVFMSTVIMLIMMHYFSIKGALLSASFQLGLIGILSLIITLRESWLKCKFWIGKTKSRYRKEVFDYVQIALISVIVMPAALIVLRKQMSITLGWGVTGEWQLVWKISEVYLSVITISLGTYFLPRLSKLKKYDEIIKEINGVAIFAMPFVIFSALVVYLCRDIAISILFTEEFNGARELFAVQLMGDVVKIASWLYAYPMISLGAKKWFIFSELAFGAFLVFFGLLFMKMWGAHGLNLAYLTTYAIYFIFVRFNLKRVVEV